MPRRVRAPAGARIRKKRKIKNKGGGVICAQKAQHGRVPKNIKLINYITA